MGRAASAFASGPSHGPPSLGPSPSPRPLPTTVPGGVHAAAALTAARYTASAHASAAPQLHDTALLVESLRRAACSVAEAAGVRLQHPMPTDFSQQLARPPATLQHMSPQMTTPIGSTLEPSAELIDKLRAVARKASMDAAKEAAATEAARSVAKSIAANETPAAGAHAY